MTGDRADNVYNAFAAALQQPEEQQQQQQQQPQVGKCPEGGSFFH